MWSRGALDLVMDLLGFNGGKVCRQPVCRLPTWKTAAHPLSVTAESVISQTTLSNSTTCLRRLFQSLEKQQTPASCVIVVVILRSVAFLGQSLTPVSDLTCTNPSLHQDPNCRNKALFCMIPTGLGLLKSHCTFITVMINQSLQTQRCADVNWLTV